MSNVPPSASAPKPRRLDFTPKSKPAEQQQPGPKRRPPTPDEARIARAKAAEVFRLPPRERPRLPADGRFELDYDAERIMWTGSLACDEILAIAEATTVGAILSVLDEKWRVKYEERRLLVEEGVPLKIASIRVSSKPKVS